MAYPGLIMRVCSNPLILLNISACTSAGREVEIPLGYTVVSFKPSGSKKIWCLVLSENFTIVSSIEGQYLGPTPLLLPDYIALLVKFFFIISWTFLFV